MPKCCRALNHSPNDDQHVLLKNSPKNKIHFASRSFNARANSKGALNPRSRVTTFIVSGSDRNGELSVPSLNNYEIKPKSKNQDDDLKRDIVIVHRESLDLTYKDENIISNIISDSVYGNVRATNNKLTMTSPSVQGGLRITRYKK